MPGCMLVIPSRCTVFIQNSLLFDWFGLTVFTSCAIAFCMFWLLPMPIIIAAPITVVAMIATAISCVCFEVVVDIFFRFILLIYYLLWFSYKQGHKFHV